MSPPLPSRPQIPGETHLETIKADDTLAMGNVVVCKNFFPFLRREDTVQTGRQRQGLWAKRVHYSQKWLAGLSPTKPACYLVSMPFCLMLPLLGINPPPCPCPSPKICPAAKSNWTVFPPLVFHLRDENNTPLERNAQLKYLLGCLSRSTPLSITPPVSLFCNQLSEKIVTWTMQMDKEFKRHWAELWNNTFALLFE